MKQKIYPGLFACLVLLMCVCHHAVAQLNAKTTRQIQMAFAEKKSRTPVERKISSQLLQAIREYHGKKMVQGLQLRPANVHADASGTLLVDINAEVSDALLAKINAVGATVVFSSKQFHSVRAKVTLSAAEAIAGYNGVKFIKPAAILHVQGNNGGKAMALNLQPNTAPAFTGAGNITVPAMPASPSFEQRVKRVKKQLQKYLMVLGTGSVNSQGDHAMGADSARAKYGYMGQGIRVGVISNSYNFLGGAAADIASGDLPGPGNPLGDTTPVTVVQDFLNTGATDEGRAMLQIVHDLAPKAQLFFATAAYGPASFASNILALRAAPNNCDIIIDDVGFADEPAFEDGMPAQAVNTVTAGGALYFSSAGNSGSALMNYSSVWEGDFNSNGFGTITADGKTGYLHNFGTIATPVFGDSIVTAGGIFTLQWADALGASNNDYDLYLLDSTGNVVGYSTNPQDGTQDPFEEIEVDGTNPGDQLVIFKDSVAQTRAMRISANLDGQGIGFKYTTAGATLGHNSAVAAFDVAATPTSAAFPGIFTSSDQVEFFSADGPRHIFYNADSTAVTPGNFTFAGKGGTVRKKPDITASDGVSTTFPSNSGLNPFYGTSAAAPHAGAIAALLKSAKPSLTAAQIRTLLTSTALDIEAAGYDYNSGYGIVRAYKAMQQLNPAALPTVSIGAITVTEGSLSNKDGIVEPGETGNITVQLTNASSANATGVNAVIATSTPGITILQGKVAYGSIAAGASRLNTNQPFTFAINSSVPCGTVVTFYVNASAGNGSVTPPGTVYTFTIGSQTITSSLGASPPAGNGYAAVSGQQTGRLSRGAVASTCANPIPPDTLVAKTGQRQYDAYTFTNSTAADECVTVSVSSANGLNIYTAAYSNAGFVPTNPAANFVANPGQSAQTMQYSFTAPAGKKFTIVVSDVNILPASGSAYSLNVSFGSCQPGPACTPVKVTNTSIAQGATGKPYKQILTASGGTNSGIYMFSVAGSLPAGSITTAGDSLFGIATQAGRFPIVITATDPTGCSSGHQNDTLVIAGITPATVTAIAGTLQKTLANTTFATNLAAKVLDSSNKALGAVKVLFTAPASGARGTFANGADTITIITDGTGLATAPAFTANGITGSYTVTAAVTGVAKPASFALANYCNSSLVTSSADAGEGSLRYVVANACPAATVTFAPGINKISLVSGEILVYNSLTIQGPGAGLLTISANNNSRIFSVDAVDTSGYFDSTKHFNISGLTLADGLGESSTGALSNGGAVFNYGATVSITGCVFTNNNALSGNGGGAVDNNAGYVTINNCTFQHNSAISAANDPYNPAFGGAIAQEAGLMAIYNSTFANNQTDTAAGVGGAIEAAAPIALVNCTFYGNAAYTGGGIECDGTYSRIYNSTFYANSGYNGGNIYSGGPYSSIIQTDSVFLINSILAGGRLQVGGSGPDISTAGPNGFSAPPVVTSLGFNLIQDTATSGITLAAGDIIGANPKLLPLANYGGPMLTLLPQPNSPVIKAGTVAGLVLQTDQRGYASVVTGHTDIGAVVTNYASATYAGTPQSAAINKPFAVALQGKVTENGNAVKGVGVIFKAPASGASGSFAGGKFLVEDTTNASGIAAAPTFTANGTTGTYMVADSIGATIAKAGFTLTNTNTLAVVFGNVTATVYDCSVQIAWQTLTGEAGENFTVEHSTNGIDYTPLYTTPGRGNSAASQAYNYTHAAPAEGANYYRIKQTDANGKITYSQTIVVINVCTTTPVIAYPNPVHEKLTLVTGGTEKQLINVFDAQGRLITRLACEAGSIEIDVSRWASGVYTMVATKADKTTYTLKIVKN